MERGRISRDDIERHLRQVGNHLESEGLTGEILILGGAYMTLVLRQRDATKDVDAYFATHAEAIRAAAVRVAHEHGLPTDWLNDAVKGFLYVQPEMTAWADLPWLRVYAPVSGLHLRHEGPGGRSEDHRDLVALRGVLSLTSAADALAIVTRHVPAHLLTARIQYLVEDLFDDDAS